MLDATIMLDATVPMPDIDVPGIVRDLVAAGWSAKTNYPTYGSDMTMALAYLSNFSAPARRYIDIWPDSIAIYTASSKTPMNQVNILDPIWQEALEIIMRHTGPETLRV